MTRLPALLCYKLTFPRAYNIIISVTDKRAVVTAKKGELIWHFPRISA